MKSSITETLSAFGRAALALDEQFRQFGRLAADLERASLRSEKGLERARTLFTEIDACRLRLSDSMKEFVQELAAVQLGNEKDVSLIAQLGITFSERQQEADRLFDEYKTIGEMVKQVNNLVAQFKKTSGVEMTGDDRAAFAQQMPELIRQLDGLVQKCEVLTGNAREASLKELEKNTESLRRNLHNARHRLSFFVERQNGPSH